MKAEFQVAGRNVSASKFLSTVKSLSSQANDIDYKGSCHHNAAVYNRGNCICLHCHKTVEVKKIPFIYLETSFGFIKVKTDKKLQFKLLDE